MSNAEPETDVSQAGYVSVRGNGIDGDVDPVVETDRVSETSVFNSALTWPLTREYCIAIIRRERSKFYKIPFFR